MLLHEYPRILAGTSN